MGYFHIIAIIKKADDGDMPEGLTGSQLEEAPFSQIMGTVIIKIKNESNKLKPV